MPAVAMHMQPAVLTSVSFVLGYCSSLLTGNPFKRLHGADTPPHLLPSRQPVLLLP